MKFRLVDSFILLLLVSCEITPNYDPFDDRLNVSVDKIIANGCDTISAGCGYFNLTRTDGLLNPFYQIYQEDFEQVVAKGFDFIVDTVVVDEYEYDLRLFEWIPEYTMTFEEALEPYGYELQKTTDSSIVIINKEKLDTIELAKRISYLDTARVQIIISYFNSPN